MSQLKPFGFAKVLTTKTTLAACQCGSRLERKIRHDFAKKNGKFTVTTSYIDFPVITAAWHFVYTPSQPISNICCGMIGDDGVRQAMDRCGWVFAAYKLNRLYS